MLRFLPFSDFSGSFCLAPKLNAEVLCSVPEHRKAVLYVLYLTAENRSFRESLFRQELYGVD